MTPEELGRIRAFGARYPYIDKLCAEIDRLNKAVDSAYDRVTELLDDRNELRRLRAEAGEAHGIARRAYHLWLSPQMQQIVKTNSGIASNTAEALGVASLPDWLVADDATQSGDGAP